MKRSHRAWHAWVWRLLAPLILIAAYIGIQAKQETPIENQQPAKAGSATLPLEDGGSL